MVPFSKIGQFRNIAKDLNYVNTVHAINQLAFEGTVKLHGTNAGIGYKNGDLWYQSRSRVLAVGDDNYGFVHEQSKYESEWVEYLRSIGTDIIVHGEWCGAGIQKGVAISELPKMFVIFKVTSNDIDVPLNKVPSPHIDGVCLITDFPTYNIVIDTEFPEKSSEALAQITDEVENECPAGKQLGVSGIGEGVVWKCTDRSYSHLMFKVKGQKHSVSKVKKIASVDPELVSSIEEFANYAVTEARLEQGIQEVGLDQKLFGNYIKWVMTDINTEESDVLEKNGLTMKQVSKTLSNRIRKYYLNKLQ